MIFLSTIIVIVVSQPKESLILQPNAIPTMTTTRETSAAATKLSSTIITILKTTLIIIPTIKTTTLVLILKTTMIIIWMGTSLVPPFPLPPIATLIIPLLEKIK